MTDERPERRKARRSHPPSADEHFNLCRRVDDIDNRVTLNANLTQHLSDDSFNLREHLTDILGRYSKDIAAIVKWTEDQEAKKQWREFVFSGLSFLNIVALIVCTIIIIVLQK